MSEPTSCAIFAVSPVRAHLGPIGPCFLLLCFGNLLGTSDLAGIGGVCCFLLSHLFAFGSLLLLGFLSNLVHDLQRVDMHIARVIGLREWQGLLLQAHI